MNYRHHMYATKGAYLISLFVLILSSSCKSKIVDPPTSEQTRTPYQNVEKQFTQELNYAASHLDTVANSTSIAEKQSHYKKARKYFKLAEPVLAFLDADNYKFLNQPNLTKIEEEDLTDIKILEPKGFQVLEEALFDEEPTISTINDNAAVSAARLRLIANSTNLTHIKPYHILWIIRNGFIRVALTGITGFDSPALKNSLQESQWVYQGLIGILEHFEGQFYDTEIFTDWSKILQNGIATLDNDFDSFDRYEFIKFHTHPTLVLWNKTVTDWKVEFPFTMAIQNNAVSLFDKNTFNLSYFSSEKFETLDLDKVALGKILFEDKSLSKSETMSCASCHKAELYYTDGKKIGKGVSRNSPTLLYAALQKGLFYDKRAGSLEGQIVSVVNNKNEFHSDVKTMVAAVQSNADYVKNFAKIYPKGVTDHNLRNAIATFIRSLIPFNSKFDRNINNLENTLTASEKKGFNLFTGKAQCATCHFAPVFNGTVPPGFRESEIEAIGVPVAADTINATISPDLGRYYVFKTEKRKHFFKTPTIRNSSKTAPFMHNGVYTDLKSVVDFYNRGGGIGIGIALENQTLPPDPLGLTEAEQEDLVAFMHALTDSLDLEEVVY